MVWFGIYFESIADKFPRGLHVGGEKEGGVRNESKGFSLSNWYSEVAVYHTGRRGKSRFGVAKSGPWLRMLVLWCPICNHVELAVGYMSPECRERSGLGCVLGIMHVVGFKALRPEGHLKNECPKRRYLSPEPGPRKCFRMRRGGISKGDLGGVAGEENQEHLGSQVKTVRCWQERLRGWRTGFGLGNMVVPGHLDKAALGTWRSESPVRVGPRENVGLLAHSLSA